MGHFRYTLKFDHYRPQRSCGQGYVFTRVCDSVHGWICLSACLIVALRWTNNYYKNISRFTTKITEISQNDFVISKNSAKVSAFKTIRIGDIFLISDQHLTMKPHLSDSLNLGTSVREQSL